MPINNLIQPLVLGKDIKKVSVSPDYLPQIVCGEYTGESKTVDIDPISVGDVIEFGRFPIDEDYIMYPLKWHVLAKENGMILLITVDEIISLDDDVRQKGVWADSCVRKMLNKGFIDVAFTEEERSQIEMSSISTPDNKKHKTNGGPDTKDKVFLLSIDEVEKYMEVVDFLQSKPTEYAHKQRYTKRDGGFWQLRTPGKNEHGSVAISDSEYSTCSMSGNHVGPSYIRPAMWIKNI